MARDLGHPLPTGKHSPLGQLYTAKSGVPYSCCSRHSLMACYTTWHLDESPSQAYYAS